MSHKNILYCDHNATRPIFPEHLEALRTYSLPGIGNPSSPHSLGRTASVILSTARKRVAKSIQFDVSEIVFVSGATEANNIATRGVLEALNEPFENIHVVTSAIEHPSIRQPLEFLRRKKGVNVTILPVSSDGFVRTQQIVEALRPNTALVTLMAANNEIGTVQPVKEFANWLHDKRWSKMPLESPLDAHLSTDISRDTLQKLCFHVDAVQAFGKLPLVQWSSGGIDMLSVSAHKNGGLVGIGALACRKGRRFEPLFFGGAQERNRRAGTENLLGALSLGLVAESVASKEWWQQIDETRRLRDRLAARLKGEPALRCNTPEDGNILPNTLHYSVVKQGLAGEDVLMQLDLAGICASSGSACSSGANLPSQVVLAMGRSESEAKNSLRLSLGPELCEADVDRIADTLLAIVSKN